MVLQPFLSVVHGQSVILDHLVFIGLFCLANGTDCLEVDFLVSVFYHPPLVKVFIWSYDILEPQLPYLVLSRGIMKSCEHGLQTVGSSALSGGSASLRVWRSTQLLVKFQQGSGATVNIMG